MDGAGGVGGLLTVTNDTENYYPSYDGNSNIVNYVDENQTSVAKFEYTPFGQLKSETGSMPEAFHYRFSTKYQDNSTGLTVYRYRNYNPNHGKWQTRDPLGEHTKKKQFNLLYGFVNNNSINAIDLLGLKTMPHIKTAIGVTAGGTALAKLPGWLFDSIKDIDNSSDYINMDPTFMDGLKLLTETATLGVQTAITFFPATCELAVFSVTTKYMRKITDQLIEKPFEIPTLPDPFQKNNEFGLSAGFFAGIEGAVYWGSGLADANSFQGIFYTGGAGGGVVAVSGYIGDRDRKGGRWIGGTFGGSSSLSLPVDVSYIYWDYQHNGNVIDLDNMGVTGKCICAHLRTSIGKIGYYDAYWKYFD